MGKKMVPDGVRLFREKFSEIFLEDLRPMPGALWILQGLKNRNAGPPKLALCTNKHRTHLREICNHLGFTACLDVIAGEGDTPYRKPQSEFTEFVLSQLSVTAEESMLVGDSLYDIETARNAGMPCHTVATGNASREALLAAGASTAHPDLFALGHAVFHLTKPLQRKI